GIYPSSTRAWASARKSLRRGDTRVDNYEEKIILTHVIEHLLSSGPPEFNGTNVPIIRQDLFQRSRTANPCRRHCKSRCCRRASLRFAPTSFPEPRCLHVPHRTRRQRGESHRGPAPTDRSTS